MNYMQVAWAHSTNEVSCGHHSKKKMREGVK